MEYQWTHIRGEYDGVCIALPNGETLQVSFDGSDPLVYLISFDGENRNVMVPNP